ncbi:MAG: sulfotransferase domain-containing protein [Prochloraceae cyanobacterium]
MKNQPLKPKYISHNGFLMAKDFPPEAFKSALQYQPEATDIFIVTYPKCGTTWMQNIVWLLENHGQPFPENKSINREIPFLETVGKDFVTALPNPRFIKTHLPFSLIPYHREAKYIYVARNPFDCVVSFYYHTKGFVEHYDFGEGTFDDFFECFIRGEVDFGDYFDNLLSWYERRDKPNILCLTYEQMQANIEGEIIKVADFLGNEYLDRVKDPQILNKIIHHSSFKSMSKNQQRWSSKRPDNMTPFIRKGTVGDWKNHFSRSQIIRLKEKFISKTQGTEIATMWSDIIPV